MSTPRKQQWFSALLVFLLDSPKDVAFKKALRSLMLFQACDFKEAHKLAIAAGESRAKKESISDASGAPELRLTFCYVETLDSVGEEIEMTEVWSQLSTDLTGVEADPNRAPSQTI